MPLVAAIPVFYRCCVSRSPYRTISWSSTWSQLRYLCVHFFVTFLLARNSIFSNGVSLGNTLFVLVAFRYWRFSPPIMSVVYITWRMSSGNWKGGADIFPVALPVADSVWVFLTPCSFHAFQFCKGCCLTWGIVNCLEVGSKFLGAFVTDIFGWVAQHMDDAPRYPRFGEYRLYGTFKPQQAVHAGGQHILHAPVMQAVQLVVDIPCAHAPGIQGNHLFLDAGDVPLVFRYQFRLGFPIPVPGHVNLGSRGWRPSLPP